MAAPIWALLVALRRRALAYRYDFSTETNTRIIAGIRHALGDLLDDANDDLRSTTRTAAHYWAQLRLRPAWSKWLFELAAIPVLPLFLVWAWLKGLFKGRGMQPVDGVRLVFPDRFRINPEIFCVPHELAEMDVTTRPLKGSFLLGRDVRRTLALFAGATKLGVAFPAQLALKCAIDLSKVRNALDGLAPTWIVVYWEFSCAMTFITGALRDDGVETYNVMHGEKNFFAKNAFFEVTRCYCWDAYYVDLFQQEHVRADYRIFQNPAFRLNPAEEAHDREHTPMGVGLVVPSLVTLSANPQETACLTEMIADACNAVATVYGVSVRPHPLYREDFHILRSRLNDAVQIVTAECESPRAFILRHAILIGTNSSMLLEAAHLGRKVIMFSTPVTTETETNHYIYRLPNVFTCSVNELTATMVQIMNQPNASPVPASEKS